MIMVISAWTGEYIAFLLVRKKIIDIKDKLEEDLKEYVSEFIESM